MPSDHGMTYLDANVMLAYIRSEEERSDTVEQILSEAAEGRRQLLTSTLSIVEVAYAFRQQADSHEADQRIESAIDALWAPASPIRLIEPSIPVMFKARSLLRQAIAGKGKGALKPADAVHLASASIAPDIHEILTYEKENTRNAWTELTGIAVEEPYLDRPRLPLA